MSEQAPPNPYSHEPAPTTAPMGASPTVAPTEAPADVKIGKPKPPAWSWVFIGMCVLIPIVALGGLIPILIGIGGASGVAAVARMEGMALGIRIGLCAGIAGTAWVVFIVFAVLIAMMMA
ncbi:MAG: hypothetical protein R3B57_08145 [Phycisphaerales bacterium]